MAKPIFKPFETPKEQYDQGVVNWSYFMMKYDKPRGPAVKDYGPYYTYTILVPINGQYVEHIWFPSVDEHRVIQMAGAEKDSVMAATYVRDSNRKGLVVMHSAGPVTQRQESWVDAEIKSGLAKLESAKAQQSGLTQNVLPPQPPQFPPQPVAPQPPAPVQQAPALPVQQQPPAPPAPSGVPPSQKPAQPPRQAPPKAPEPESRVYYPVRDREDFKSLMGEVAKDAAYLRRLAFDTVAEVFNDVLPEAKSAPQQLDRFRLIVDLSAPINMKLDKKMYHMWENGERWSLAKEPLPTPDTKEGALAAIDQLDPADYPDKDTFIWTWLSNVAEPHEGIKVKKHAASIANVLGIDSDVIYSEHDTDTLLMFTQAIWSYQDARDEGLARNEALEAVSDRYGMPKEYMKFEDE